MYFRCVECQASTWIDRLEPVRAGEILECADCGRSYCAKPIRELGPTIGELYQSTLKHATSHGIDMASAYSVLLGVMSPEDAQLLQQTGASTVRGAARPAPAALADIDPAFDKAVAAGHLTLQDALERGDRDALAATLARRHGLTETVAYAVADKRIGLGEAVRRRPAADREAGDRSRGRPVSRLQAGLVLGSAALALAIVVGDLCSSTFAPRRSARSVSAAAPAALTVQPPALHARRLASTEVRTDDEGQPVEIVGPDPAAVLAAFCSADSWSIRPEPLEITEDVPPSGGVRLGLFRDWSDVAKPRAIRIRQDARSRRWIAGTGHGRIPVSEAPELPQDALRVAVTAG